MKTGCWDSINVVEASSSENNEKAVTYKLTTTVMLNMNVERGDIGDTVWSGSLTRQVSVLILALLVIKNRYIIFSRRLS